jgi:hypothetical protein
VKTLGSITYQQAEVKENLATLRYAQKYGVEHVRGGKYCTLKTSKKFHDAYTSFDMRNTKKRKTKRKKVKYDFTPKSYSLTYPYRYKSKLPPKERFPNLNGPVIVIKPANGV